MFKIYDGRDSFYQWDLDRKLIVEDKDITQVHFCNRTDECSLVCETYTEDGLNLVNVPNVLLQDDWRINVYAYDHNYTKHSTQYDVIRRSKPDSYVYTETETLNYNVLLERMNKIDEDLEQSINDYFVEHPVEVDLTGYATEEYVGNAIAAIPDPDLSAYALKTDIPSTVGLASEKYVNSSFKDYYGRYGVVENGLKKTVINASSLGANYNAVGQYMMNNYKTIGSTFLLKWDLPDETTTYGVYYNPNSDRYATGVNVLLKQNHYYYANIASNNLVREQLDKYWNNNSSNASANLDSELGICWASGLVKDLTLGGLACLSGEQYASGTYYIFRDTTADYAFNEIEGRITAIEQSGGSGDVDLSNYYTKAEIDALIPASGEEVSY